MGLYLCVFDGDNELDGVEVGSYSDYGDFLDTISTKLEGGAPGTRFPTLILHSDCDGEWSSREASVLAQELIIIERELRELEPRAIPEDSWQSEVARIMGLHPVTMEDTFFDVDGEPLIQRLIQLCRVAQRVDRPILFQ